MKKITALFFLLACCTASQTKAQDTISIDASTINTKVLRKGTHRYLIYFKMGKDSSRKNYQLWSRTIQDTTYQGRDAISITQQWEDNDTIIHKALSIVGRKDFSPLYHRVWWKRTREQHVYDFIAKNAQIAGKSLAMLTDSVNKKRNDAFETALTQSFFIWHLDLETFPLLPYKTGAVFRINFYDPGFSPPAFQYYSVAGSGTLTGYDDQAVDCWLLKHGSLPQNQEIFWISKKTKEVLKLEQEFSGRYRYKIKLGYSD